MIQGYLNEEQILCLKELGITIDDLIDGWEQHYYVKTKYRKVTSKELMDDDDLNISSKVILDCKLIVSNKVLTKKNSDNIYIYI